MVKPLFRKPSSPLRRTIYIYMTVHSIVPLQGVLTMAEMGMKIMLEDLATLRLQLCEHLCPGQGRSHA